MEGGVCLLNLTKESCQMMCDIDPTCESFSYEGNDNCSCWLYNPETPKKPNDNSTLWTKTKGTLYMRISLYEQH